MTSEISFGNANSGFQVGQSRRASRRSPPSSTLFRNDQKLYPAHNPTCPSVVTKISSSAEGYSIRSNKNALCQGLGQPLSALVVLGNLNSPLNMPTESESDPRKRGSSRSTRATWAGLSKAIGTLQARSRSLGDRIPMRTYSSSCTIGCMRAREESGFLSSAMLTVSASLAVGASLDIPAQAGNSIASRSLREYLPQSQNGSILVTSRSREAALKLVEKSDIIEVNPIDETHVLALFEKKLGEPSDSKEIAELAATLEYMPLTIVQVAAYISQRAPRSPAVFTSKNRSGRKVTLFSYLYRNTRAQRQ